MRIKTFELEKALPHQKIASPNSPNYGMTHLINLMGNNVTYVETGVGKGVSISSVVQMCPNIKAAYGIDFYKPNTDEFERQTKTYNEEEVLFSYSRAKDRIQRSGHKDKVTLIREDVSVAVNYFDNNSIDILFLDHYLNEKDVADSLPMWYNKVKIGGYFGGHDWIYRGVRTPIYQFRNTHNITSPLSIFGGEWVWKKEGNI